MTTAETEIKPPIKKPVKREPRYLINVGLGNDNEPVRIFVGGGEEGDYLITRGKDVVVPKSVLTRLDDAVVGVPEIDEHDSEKVVFVERKRFPYTVLREVA